MDSGCLDGRTLAKMLKVRQGDLFDAVNAGLIRYEISEDRQILFNADDAAAVDWLMFKQSTRPHPATSPQPVAKPYVAVEPRFPRWDGLSVEQTKRELLTRRHWKGTIIYFFQPRGGGNIKIGITVHPARRLAEIQTLSPVPIDVLGLIAGDKQLELDLHHTFRHSRLHGEWFHPADDLLDFIKTYSRPYETWKEAMKRRKRTRTPKPKTTVINSEPQYVESSRDAALCMQRLLDNAREKVHSTAATGKDADYDAA